MKQAPSQLRVIIRVEDGVYVAQCVDYEIAAHGETPEEALRAFTRAYIQHILVATELGVDPFAARRRDVDESQWDEAVAIGAAVTPFRIPSFTLHRAPRQDESFFPLVGQALVA